MSLGRFFLSFGKTFFGILESYFFGKGVGNQHIEDIVKNWSLWLQMILWYILQILYPLYILHTFRCLVYGIHTLNLYPLYFKAVWLARQGHFQPRQKSIKGFQVYTPWKFNSSHRKTYEISKGKKRLPNIISFGFELLNFGCFYKFVYLYVHILDLKTCLTVRFFHLRFALLLVHHFTPWFSSSSGQPKRNLSLVNFFWEGKCTLEN